MELVDQLKSEDQMEIMMMMMHQTDKTRAFCGAYNDIAQFSPSDYAGASVCDSITAVPHCSDGFQPSSYSFLNFPSSSSFTSASPPLSTEKQTTFSSGWESELSIGENGFFSSPDSGRPTSMATMREMIFRIAAMQPIHIDPEAVKPPKRRNVKISKDPQSVAARHRREKISERIRILQRLVPGGTKMDTASMLDEAIHYVKFLKGQVQSLERAAASRLTGMGYPIAASNGCSYFPMARDFPIASWNLGAGISGDTI